MQTVVLERPWCVEKYAHKAFNSEQAERRLKLGEELCKTMEVEFISTLESIKQLGFIDSIRGFCKKPFLYGNWKGNSQQCYLGKAEFEPTDNVGYYEMCLLNGRYWVFAPFLFELAGLPADSFINVKELENKLFFVSSELMTQGEEIQHSYDLA
ncbi:hypothetical protein [Vibrio mediterranei]|uniref:hypothetical protein n=1 Tax=Vibrio mediterranei TaxID=689 RepID=UPI004067990C